MVAALVTLTALLKPPAMILLLSPTQRQSGELFRKVKGFYRALSRPRGPQRFLPVPVRELERRQLLGPDGDTVQESALQMELANGSRIISLPGKADTVVGYSGVNLLVIDEASRVADSLYRAVRPMLAVSNGRLVCLSTPLGKRGFFYEEWQGVGPDGRPLPHRDVWRRIQVRASECSRISPEFLAEEKASLGLRWYRQEYECSFEDAIGCAFDPASIQRALLAPADEPPLF